MTTSQKLTEASLDAAIRSTQSCRQVRVKVRDAANEVCCNGDCHQGRLCPRYRTQPSRRSWLWADRAVLAIGLGCIVAAILSATGALQ